MLPYVVSHRKDQLARRAISINIDEGVISQTVCNLLRVFDNFMPQDKYAERRDLKEVMGNNLQALTVCSKLSSTF